MPVEPLPCGSGAGDGGADVEQTLLCDVLPDGSIAGTALAVYEYDADGNPAGPPTFVAPATGAPYVAQGILQPCPGDVGCGAPVQFCFQSTAPVDQPGRMYDTVLTLAQGFPVQALVKDLVETPLNILWEVTDPDGTAFAADLQTALQSQFPGQTVTVTPGVVDVCAGGTADFAIHVECLRIDQNPPTLLQLKYNSGRDLIINPAYLSTPPQNQFAFLKRQDGVSPVAVADVNCTNIANRGWETNDKSASFETWGPPGSGQNVLEGTTPTPRGTVVQEINSFGSGPTPTTGANAGNPNYGSNPDTIWQTFVVPAAGNFVIKVVVGGRATTENIPIKLSAGDVGDAGIGDVINTSVNAPKVTTEGGTPAAAWTTFTQTVPLAAGTYTLAFTGPENQTSTTDDNAFGGLFTDMRVYQDAPNTIENFVNDDDTCVVPTTENSTVCEFWAPRCAGGDIVGWYNVADGEELTNAQFWAQVPAPTCCSGTSGEGSSSVGNLVYTYLVCGTLNGERRTMSRVVVSDQSGGIIADSFVDTDGGPVTPDTWQPGDCGGDAPTVGEFVLCDDNGPFVRTLIQNAQGVVTSVVNTTLGGAPYVPVGPVVTCDAGCSNATTLLLCDVPNDTPPTGTPTVTDSGQQFIADIPGADFIQRPGGGGALWTGGVINLGPDVSSGPGITQVHRFVSATLQAPAPACTNGTAHVSLSVEAQNLGPAASCSGAGRFRLYRVSDGAVLGSGTPLFGTPVGQTDVLTIEADVPAADLAATNVAVWLDVETFQTGTCPPPDGKTWQARNFTAAFAYDVEGCETQFLRTVLTDCETGATLATVDTTMDGAPYVPTGEVGQCAVTGDSGGDCPCVSAADIGQAVAAEAGDTEVLTLCDDGTDPVTPFLRRLTFDGTGALTGTVDTDFTGAPYVVTGEAVDCPGGCTTASSIGTVCYTPPVAVQTLQDDWTGATSVLGGGSRVWTNPNFAGAGITVTETVTPDTGAALLGAGVRNTATSPASQHTAIDLGAPRSNVTVRMDFFGSVQGERLRNVSPAFAAVSGNGTAVLANTGVDGGPAGDGTIFLNFPGPIQNISWDYAPTGGGLSGQSFISFNSGNASNSAPAAVLRDCVTGATTLVDLATGTVLNPAAISIVDCPDAVASEVRDARDEELLVLCDSTPTRFLRRYNYDATTGALVGIVNTTLDGSTPFAPVGAVGVCTTAIASDFDFLSTVLCDSNGTQFIQRLTFNSATGAVTATTNTTLTGGAFAPVGAVSLCSNCCPAVIGQGCTNTGSGFYTAIRATNGTISLIDSVSGAAVLAANIVPCPSDNTARTLTAQARQLTNATPWTPGADVVGTLTSLTVTGLSGLWDLVDQNGTALTGLPAGLTLTWSAEDDNTLTGPTSVTPQAGASVVANWTVR
ncbi:hypothetical protein [Embleya sp. NPDC001921]